MRERETSMCEKHLSVAFHTHPTGDETRSLGMCPDWEQSPPPFGVVDGMTR